ncbi:MAG: CBS domain-containing protein [Cyanobacteria bacterium P01_H01_bin.58]
MPFETTLSWVPDLEDVIERQPLTVSSDTLLVDAIALISQAHHQTCLLAGDSVSSNKSAKAVRASCVLVTQGKAILGILTERDVVRLTAQAINLKTTTVAEVMAHPVVTLPDHSVQDIFAALFLFRRYRIRHVPIVDNQEKLVGVISHESIRQVLRPANLLRFRRVSDVMSTDVIQAPLTATVLQLAQLMATHHVSCIVITQLDAEDIEQPVGIVTERDIVQFQALQIDLARTEAQTVMSSPLFLLNPQDSLWIAHQEMQKRRVGRLVVSWNWGKGLGIVTQTSLLRVFDPMEMYGVIENLQQTIHQLEAKQAKSSSHSSSLQLNAQVANLDRRISSSDEGTSTQSKSIACDSERLSSSLNHIHDHLKQIVDNPNLSPNQQQTQLRSLLDRLKQLSIEFNSAACKNS